MFLARIEDAPALGSYLKRLDNIDQDRSLPLHIRRNPKLLGEFEAARIDLCHLKRHVSQQRFSNASHHKLSRAVTAYSTQHMPLALIIGDQPFLNLKIKTLKGVLIPRSETEEWCSRLANILRLQLQRPSPSSSSTASLKILEVGTGSGCIALALAAALPTTCIHAIDIDKKAIGLANNNLRMAAKKFPRLLEQVVFEHADVLDFGCRGKFDMIVSNAPYIPSNGQSSLPKSVRRWESQQALFADESGLKINRHIIEIAPRLLTQTFEYNKLPRILLEINGASQVDGLSVAAQLAGFDRIAVQKDYAGHTRLFTCA